MAAQWYVVDHEGRRLAVLVVGLVDGLEVAGHPGIRAAQIPPYAIVGSAPFTSAGPDLRAVARNPAFVEFYVGYMRGEASEVPAVLSEARVGPSEYLYVVDPRNRTDRQPFEDIVGWYVCDADGRPRRETFAYNADHRIHSEPHGLTGLAYDRGLERAVVDRILAETPH